MLLAIDVGNTNMTFGLFDGRELKKTFSIMTAATRTSDEYGLVITDLIDKQNIAIEKITAAVIATVVPNTTHSLTNAVKKYLKCDPLLVGPGVKTGIRIDTPNPKEVGADRIVDAVAAYEKYGGPVLVIDFGTATTYDLVTEDGRFTVGITAPGIRISARALWEDTAKLPEIEIKKPKSILAQDTITSMQAGLVYGQIGQTEYIINQVRRETGYDNMRVIATGGLGSIIANETDMIEVYDRQLTLEGLRLIYDRNS
ncbi:MAG: type III pantothenate kinase [Lachnospiraceae bacterium]|nr:type III pantothenate kinase [Lachnospiraceae bacterium]